MKVHLNVFICLCFIWRSLAENKCELAPKGNSYAFPKDFSFGVSTAAYQIEGAWNEEGKAPSVWDTYTHAHPEMIADGTNGDNTTESYHRFEQDLAALKELKLNFYRFSISWPRVLPNITTMVKNEKGIAYYNNMIDRLLANNIEPMVTMYHFDMPEELNTKYNGFLNNIFIDYFETYADFLYETFGDRVKKWVTFNEPHFICTYGYGDAFYPPLVQNPGVADYICMDTALRAHAKAYRLYKAKYFERQRGKIGITLNCRVFYKKYADTPDEAIERGLQYYLGWFAEPIYGKHGNYPEIIIADVGNNSLKDGYRSSRLPVINDEWSKIIKGSGDFLGINYYFSNMVEMATEAQGKRPSFQYDANIVISHDDTWKYAKSDWLFCVPQGLEDLLKWIRHRYENVEVYVLENGWSDDGQLNDSGRTECIQAHLQAVLNAIDDGCNVTHYAHWSLIDNFEWNLGYTEKFGLYYVNMTSPNKERIQKDSAKYYARVIESRQLPTINAGVGMQSAHEIYFVFILLIAYQIFSNIFLVIIKQ